MRSFFHYSLYNIIINLLIYQKYEGSSAILNDTFEDEAVLMHDALHEAYMDDMDHVDDSASATQHGDDDGVSGLDPFMSDPR